MEINVLILIITNIIPDNWLIKHKIVKDAVVVIINRIENEPVWIMVNSLLNIIEIYNYSDMVMKAKTEITVLDKNSNVEEIDLIDVLTVLSFVLLREMEIRIIDPRIVVFKVKPIDLVSVVIVVVMDLMLVVKSYKVNNVIENHFD